MLFCVTWGPQTRESRGAQRLLQAEGSVGALCPSPELGAWGRGDHTRVGSGFAWSLLLAVELQSGWTSRITSFSGPHSAG